MFIQRDGLLNIIGVYACFQPGVAEEELPNNDPAVIAFINRSPPSLTPTELETDCLSALNGGTNRINEIKLIKAKFISDLAWRLGKTPGTLTLADIQAERARIAAIYKNL